MNRECKYIKDSTNAYLILPALNQSSKFGIQSTKQHTNQQQHNFPELQKRTLRVTLLLSHLELSLSDQTTIVKRPLSALVCNMDHKFYGDFLEGFTRLCVMLFYLYTFSLCPTDRIPNKTYKKYDLNFISIDEWQVLTYIPFAFIISHFSIFFYSSIGIFFNFEFEEILL